MPNVCATNPEDDVGGDIGSVVGDALEVLGDKDSLHGLLGELWLLFDQLEQVSVGQAIHAIDIVVHGAH
jgi:hypothetical protein